MKRMLSVGLYLAAVCTAIPSSIIQSELKPMPAEWWLNVPSAPLVLLANPVTGFTEWNMLTSKAVTSYQTGCVDPSTYAVVKRDKEVRIDFETREQAIPIWSVERRARACTAQKAKMAVIRVRFKDTGVWLLGTR